MAFSAPASRTELAEINITPLVVVLMVLLVIFMVTAPMLSQPFDAILPQRTDRQIDQHPPNDLVLKVCLGGLYTLDDRPVTLVALRTLLDDARVSDPKTVLQVEAVEGAEYQQLVDALAQAEASGIRNIVMRD